MIPVLYKLDPNTPLKQAIVYLLAVLVVAYAVFAGWRGAHGPPNAKTHEFGPASTQQKLGRAAIFGAVGIALALLGLYYILPATSFLGRKGEGIPIHTYGLLLATGFVAAVSLIARLAEREWPGEEGTRKRDQVLDLSFWVLISAIVGSRLLFIVVNWKDYASDLTKIFELGGGLVFYGGLIGAMIASFIYARKNNIDFFRLADVAMPGISLGQALGRLGCFSAGCCWGSVTSKGFRFGVHFPGAAEAKTLFGQVSGSSALAYQSQLNENPSRWVVESTGQVYHHAVPGAVRIADWVGQHGHTLPIHPTQLYESVGQFALFVFLLVMRRYRRFHGQILGMWLMLYAILRSTVELFRGDIERGTLNGLLNDLNLTSMAQKVPLEAWYNISISQFISLCMFSLGAAILYRRGRDVLLHPAPLAAST
jgi:phosphatidylglycerol:prolipoprotein diacylglycerol transferase